MYVYDSNFYRHINRGALSSAAALVPAVKRWFDVKSVVDFGCGQGAWLSVWKDAGATEVLGLDGDYVDRAGLLVEPAEFHGADLSRPVLLGRQFDLVQSMEVAEHLHAKVADTFVDNLVRHGTLILFSAAVPGQLGENHVNERPFEYWRDKFAARDYVLIDALRPALRGGSGIDPWYRHNSLLYVRRDRLDALPAALLAYRIRDGAPIPSFAPLYLRTVFGVTRFFPHWLNHGLSVLNKNISRLHRKRMTAPARGAGPPRP